MKPHSYFKWLFFAFTYFVAAYAGMAISDRSQNITVIWVASGVALAGLGAATAGGGVESHALRAIGRKTGAHYC